MSLLLWANAVLKAKAEPADAGITINRTLDRSFGNGVTPASGGGNVEPDRFVHEGANWELWQVIPFLGPGIATVGDCRVQLRNRDKSRGQNLLTDMPVRVVIAGNDWTGLPWTFTRPTANNKFNNVSSGNSGRKGIDYEPVHNIGTSPAAVGIAEDESFTITLFFE